MYVAKTQAPISYAVTSQMACPFIFAYAKSRISREEAQLILTSTNNFCFVSGSILQTHIINIPTPKMQPHFCAVKKKVASLVKRMIFPEFVFISHLQELLLVGFIQEFVLQNFFVNVLFCQFKGQCVYIYIYNVKCFVKMFKYLAFIV